jgi:exonuclease III
MLLMDRNWIILDWNLRGINSQTRWDDIRQKIDESGYNVICFQETKREHFDNDYLRNFCPRRFNQFVFSPSVGNSGGIITIWNGNLFSGQCISLSRFQVTVELTYKISNHIWYITNVYGPTVHEERDVFTNWLLDLDATPMDSWVILGDFNLIRSPENRNRIGGDINNMLLFNRIISQLDLVEIPLKGRAFTWSNMQDNPLLEKLDWIFTSANWTTLFPHTIATPLAKLSSDHIPIKVQISTSVPKACLFRFEDYWMEFDGFYDTIQSSWHSHIYRNSAQDLVARLKSVRHGLKKWVETCPSSTPSLIHAILSWLCLMGWRTRELSLFMNQISEKPSRHTPSSF